MAQDGKLEVFRSDTFNRTVTIRTKSTGNPIDITGYEVRFTIRRQPQATNANTLGNSDAIISVLATLTDPTNGIATINIPKADMNIEVGEYLYDIQITDSAGDDTTAIADKFIIKTDVSR